MARRSIRSRRRVSGGPNSARYKKIASPRAGRNINAFATGTSQESPATAYGLGSPLGRSVQPEV